MMARALTGRTHPPDGEASVASIAGMSAGDSGSDWRLTAVLADHYGLEHEMICAASFREAID